MRVIQLSMVCVAVLSAAPGQVRAGIVTFDSSPDNSYWVTPITSEGFTFSDITGEGSLGTDDNLDDFSVNNGTIHLLDWVNVVNGGMLSAMRMEATDGSLFSLFSFDFTSGYIDGSQIANQLSVTGYDTGNAIIANAIFTSSDYSHLSFTRLNVNSSFQGLQYVIFEATGLENRVGYDNFVVTPEPSFLTLFGIGACVAGLRAARRRRREKP